MAVEEEGQSFTAIETSFERLKLLNYKIEFCKKNNIQALNPMQFVLPTENIGSQFEVFISLCSWLFKVISTVSGVDEKLKIDQLDDPTSCVNKLALALRSIGFDMDFPAQKLKVPHGSCVCSVIDFLTTYVLSCAGKSWNRLIHLPMESEIEEAEANMEADVGDAILEDVQQQDTHFGRRSGDGSRDNLDTSPRNTLKPTQTAAELMAWKSEIERVSTRVKSVTSLEIRDWRVHADQTIKHKTLIANVGTGAEEALTVLNKDALEYTTKLAGKETVVNKQMMYQKNQIDESGKLVTDLEAKVTGLRLSLKKKNQHHDQMCEEQEDIVERLESRDEIATNTSPLIQLRSAIKSIKEEIHQIDLRVGMVSHIVQTASVQAAAAAKVANIMSKKNKKKRGASPASPPYAPAPNISENKRK